MDPILPVLMTLFEVEETHSDYIVKFDTRNSV